MIEQYATNHYLHRRKINGTAQAALLDARGVVHSTTVDSAARSLP
jgi:hypothetical protein